MSSRWITGEFRVGIIWCSWCAGTYAEGANGALPLADYLRELGKAAGHSFDWMLCSFGADETASLVEAVRAGGKVRVGFENSLLNADGSRAADNAERVREVLAATAISVPTSGLPPSRAGKRRAQDNARGVATFFPEGSLDPDT